MNSIGRFCVLFIALLGYAIFTSASPEQTVTVWTWPTSAASPQQLAKVTYHPDTLSSTIQKYTPPTNFKTLGDVIRVGLYDSKAKIPWRGIAIPTNTFDAHYQQRLTLHVDRSGQVFHIGFNGDPKKELAKKVSRKDNPLLVEIVKTAPGPVPHLNKPVVVSADGKIEGQEPEKSFIQKYWWLFAVFLILQMMMATTSDDKK